MEHGANIRPDFTPAAAGQRGGGFVLAPAGRNTGIAKRSKMGFNYLMQTLEKIEAEVKQLSKAEQEALRDWLENMLEDELELTDEFKAKIERGEADLRAGRVRHHAA